MPRSADPDNVSAPVLSAALGSRIADLRVAGAFTQAELAARVAISRVALSNLESGRSVPGERTVTLLAGVFDMEPFDLVDGTDYPRSKADRLPLVTARHTEVALQLALLDRDLRWLESAPARLAQEVVQDWSARLADLASATFDERESARISAALVQLRSLST